MDPAEIESARRRLEDARRILADGRDGASTAWLHAIEDYVELCLEDYVKALERSKPDSPRLSTPDHWSSRSNGAPDGQRGDRSGN
jgi:hypothetical protein